MERKLGIVFAGGGGKGAYQIGVWKALNELGISSNVSVVSGTSVGGLNAALFMTESVELAEKIWLEVKEEDIISLNKSKIKQLGQLMNFPINSIYSHLSKLIKDGMFSNDGLLSILHNKINLNAVSHSNIVGYITCCNKENIYDIEYIKLNFQEPETILKYLLATSAIPLIFPSSNVDGKEYVDGGTRGFLQGKWISEGYDNVPILPLVAEGCDTAIVVHLSASTIVKKENFPELKLYEIFPSKRLGGLFDGTLNFSPESIKEKIELGYNDTMNILLPLVKTSKHLSNIAKAYKMQTDFSSIRNSLQEIKNIKAKYRNKNN